MSTVDNIPCPVCDAEIPSDSKKCPVCGVDLGLFDLGDTDLDSIDSTESLDDVLNILDEEMDEEEFIEKIKDLGGDKSFDLSQEEVVVDDGEIAEEMIVFECPLCGEDVAEDDSVCPSCGAVFEEEEEVDLEAEAEEALSQARSMLAQVREANLGVTLVKDMLKKASKAKKEGDHEVCINLVEDISRNIDDIMDLHEMMKVGKEKVKEMKDEGMDYKPYLEELKKAKANVDKGLYEEATSILDTGIENMIAALEKPVEEKDEEEPVKEELDELLDDLKTALGECRQTNLDLTYLKDLVKKAVSARKNGEYQEGVDISRRALDVSEDILEVSESIEHSKERLKTMREQNMDFKPYIGQIKKAKKTAEDGDMELSIERISSIIEEMDDKIQEFERKDEEKAKIHSKIKKELQELDKGLMGLKGSSLSIDHLLGLRADITKTVEDEDYEATLDNIEELNELNSKAVRVTILIDESRSRLDELKEEGGEFEVFKEKMERARDIAENGEYDNAIDILNENIEEMEDALLDLEKKEEQKVSVKEIEKMVSELRDLLVTARDNGVKIDGGKEIIEKAVRSTAAKDFQHTLSLLKDGRKKLVEKIVDKIDEKMISLELIAEEKEIPEIMEQLDKVKSSLEGDDYKGALKSIADAEEFVEEEEVSADEDVGETKAMYQNAEDMVRYARGLGFEVSDAEDMLSKAKVEMMNANEKEAVILIDELKDEIIEQVPSRLKAFVKTAQTDLRRAKISGVDISEPISLLKQASFAREDDELEECFEYMKKYQIVMEEKWD